MDMQKNGDVAGVASGWVTATLALSALLASLGTSIANIAVPALAQAFAAPFAEVQAVVVSYLVALTVSVVAAGRLGDRFGLRTVLLAGSSSLQRRRSYARWRRASGCWSLRAWRRGGGLPSS